jgi:hypothetical protein
MFRDLDNVKFISGKGGEDEFVHFYIWTHPEINLLKLGHENLNRYPELNFDQVFYKVAGIPFEKKFEDFYVKRDEKIENEVCAILNPMNIPYVFIHQDTTRGFTMNMDYIKDKDLKIIESNFKFDGSKDYLVFHYMKLIEEAQEVHVMESAFKCMIDGYIKQKDNMFFHKYMREGVSAVGRAYWNIINKR